MRTREENIPKLMASVKKVRTDRLFLLQALAAQEIRRRISRFFDDPDELRSEVPRWSDMILQAITGAAAMATADPERAEVETAAELERILVAESITRELEVGDGDDA